MLPIPFSVARSSHSSIWLAVRVDAGKVGRRRQTEPLLDLDAPVDGPRPGGPACSVRARHKDGAIGSQAAQGAEQALVAVRRFRRKNLDRHAAPAVAVHFTDAHCSSQLRKVTPDSAKRPRARQRVPNRGETINQRLHLTTGSTDRECDLSAGRPRCLPPRPSVCEDTCPLLGFRPRPENALDCDNRCPPCCLSDCSAAAPADHPGVELRYHGSLAKASRDGETTGEPVKRFDLYCLATPQADGGREVDVRSRRARRRRMALAGAVWAGDDRCQRPSFQGPDSTPARTRRDAIRAFRPVSVLRVCRPPGKGRPLGSVPRVRVREPARFGPLEIPRRRRAAKSARTTAGGSTCPTTSGRKNPCGSTRRALSW